MGCRLPWGAVPGIIPLTWDTNDPQAVTIGLRYRLGRKLPPIDYSILPIFENFVKQFLKDNLKPLTTYYTYQEWRDTLSFPESRLLQLDAAHATLLNGKPSMADCRKIKSFIKSESYEVCKYARWINSRSDAWKTFAGPCIKSMECVLYRLKWFIKNTPVPERASRVSSLKRPGARYFVEDFKKFEGSFLPDFIKACENQLLAHMFQRFPDVADLLCSVNSGLNCGATRLGVFFQCRGKRMSGEMHTSSNNGFTNLMLKLFWAWHNHAVIDGFVEGDDSVFALYEGEYATPAQYAKLGFEVKMDEFPDPGMGKFCGLQSAGNVNLIDPHRFFQKFGWIFGYTDAGFKKLCMLLRGKALSAIWESPSCPITSIAARVALRFTTGLTPIIEPGWASTHYCENNNIPAFEPDINDRIAYARLYSIPVEAQLEIERQLWNYDMTLLSCFVRPNADEVRLAPLLIRLKGQLDLWHSTPGNVQQNGTDEC